MGNLMMMRLEIKGWGFIILAEPPLLLLEVY
jgi:hypothetical protein